MSIEHSRKVLVLILALAVFLGGGISSASDLSALADAPEQRDKWEKLGRGLSNVALGWTDVFAQPYQMGHEQRLPIAILGGGCKGVAMTVARAVVGVYEIITFPFPVPGGYEPIIKPEIPMPAGTESN